jgi:hypothetical protein
MITAQAGNGARPRSAVCSEQCAQLMTPLNDDGADPGVTIPYS